MANFQCPDSQALSMAPMTARQRQIDRFVGKLVEKARSQGEWRSAETGGGCRASRKYGIISVRRGRWSMPGEREVQLDEGEDVERRTELYTLTSGGRRAVESSKCQIRASGSH
ncbi:hypothetical protein N7509_003876 [Penicillium cosmopolitanum]|uniref:Uncharacterized protein n=1 Tax=Penicillium cosmopolitanum TaxID=1131564 RepID=A0A9X0BBS2_9EURO|nr:uncharacterized protein N7509_003876 [Penicillium cosmopolitanum]KAJ5404005.1 hypothetical protein N7509_003876 [Penicillium cosmopolitanum]